MYEVEMVSLEFCILVYDRLFGKRDNTLSYVIRYTMSSIIWLSCSIYCIFKEWFIACGFLAFLACFNFYYTFSPFHFAENI